MCNMQACTSVRFCIDEIRANVPYHPRCAITTKDGIRNVGCLGALSAEVPQAAVLLWVQVGTDTLLKLVVRLSDGGHPGRPLLLAILNLALEVLS